MELSEIIDDLLKQSTEAHNKHVEAVRADDQRTAERLLYVHVMLLHAAKMIDSAMKRCRYVGP